MGRRRHSGAGAGASSGRLRQGLKGLCEAMVANLCDGVVTVGLNVCFAFVIFYMIVLHVLENIHIVESNGRQYRYALS